MNAEVDAEAGNFDIEERAEGFQSNAGVQEAIEEYAMDRAREKLCGLGFHNFKNTSAWACYDYSCEFEENLYYVEVQGTQTSGPSIILTKNEVSNIQKLRLL